MLDVCLYINRLIVNDLHYGSVNSNIPLYVRWDASSLAITQGLVEKREMPEATPVSANESDTNKSDTQDIRSSGAYPFQTLVYERASASSGDQLMVIKTYTVSYAYDENGLRTQKTYNRTTTNYYHNGSALMDMVTGMGTTAIHQLFSYDSSGNVVSVDYSTNGGSTFTTYYYVRNAQNDVVKLINGSGTTVVGYTYDTWGKLLSTTGSLASTLGANQPFRYRGYVYDTETGWYYLQSRYYDPSIGRFISADELLSTGQGVLGHNAFAYCLNNPVNSVDSTGTYGQDFSIWNETWTDDEIAGGVRKPDKYYLSQRCHHNSNYMSTNDVESFYITLGTDIRGLPNSYMDRGHGQWRYFGHDGKASVDFDIDNKHGEHYHKWGLDENGNLDWRKEHFNEDPRGNMSELLNNRYGSSYEVGISIASATFITIVLLIDKVTGVGFADDALIPVVWMSLM